MATFRHAGRETPVFVVEGNPDNFVRLINNHGILSRVMRSRKCPCAENTGSPNNFCNLCHGDGYIYDFQRKLLQADEDSDVRGDRSVVLPFRIPILDVLSVERLIANEQGGIKKYTVDSFDSLQINISGSPLPFHYERMRVSYFFDRYNFVSNDRVTVNTNTKSLTTTKTLFDGLHRHGNVEKAHGDITLVSRVFDEMTNHNFTDFTFRKNIIQIASGEPEPTPGKILVDYHYAPVTLVLPADLDNRNDQEKFTTNITSGEVRFGLESWYELSEGDLITLLVPNYFTDQIIVHSNFGIDKLLEFDIARLDDEIIDEDGIKYRQGADYFLRPFRDIVWIGNQPDAGKCFSVKFAYHPTYKIFIDRSVPNNLENKQYPITVMGKLWSMTLQKDPEQIKNPEFSFIN